MFVAGGVTAVVDEGAQWQVVGEHVGTPATRKTSPCNRGVLQQCYCAGTRGEDRQGPLPLMTAQSGDSGPATILSEFLLGAFLVHW